MDGADEGVAECTVGDDLDLKRETILLRQGVAEIELHRKIPRRAGSSVAIDAGFELLGVVDVAVERNDGVYVHLGYQIDILEILGGNDHEV